MESQLVMKLNHQVPHSILRMPRAHELLSHFQQGYSMNFSNNLQEEKTILQCLHCRTESVSDNFTNQNDLIPNHNVCLCYDCNVEVLANETVQKVIRKLCFKLDDAHEEEIPVFTSPTPGDTSKDLIGTSRDGYCPEEVKSETVKTSVTIRENKVVKVGWTSSVESDQVDSYLSPRNSNHRSTEVCKSPESPRSPNSLSFEESGYQFAVNIFNGRHVSQIYTNETRIGSGKFGKVSRLTHKETGLIVAVKTIVYRNQETRKNILNEIQILDSLQGNDHVMQLIEVIDNDISRPKTMNLVTEFLGGGELFDQIAKDELLTEDQVINIMCQILDGVNFIHNRGIIHRDLKPENIVYTSKESGQLKIIDFGFAIRFDYKKPPKTMVGTTIFVAPEVLRYEPQSYLTDMWSVGVIAYNLLAGITPFEIPTSGDLTRTLEDREIIENIERCKYDFNDEGFIGVSEEAKDLISSLIIRDPSKRLTANQCLKHSWLSTCYGKNPKNLSRSISLQRMKNYVAIHKWQKIGMAIQTVNLFKSSLPSL